MAVLTNKQFYILGGVAVVGAGLLYFQGRKVVSQAADAVNPTSHGNIFNRAANWMMEEITGEEGATIGGKIYEWTHDNSDIKVINAQMSEPINE